MSFEFSKLSNTDFLELSKTTTITNMTNITNVPKSNKLKEPIEIDLSIRENSLNSTKIKSNNSKSIGFIILRHVNNELTNFYWMHCYDCIRIFYPECFIIIIDDNSNYQYITEKQLYKTKIINSEYHGRGELLPYYYYVSNKLFDTAVIIHDSVFINKHIDLNVDKYKLLWEFEHEWDQIVDETNMINLFNDNDLLEFYQNKNLWKGCSGAMSIVTHDYLVYINSKYEFSKLLNCVLNRYNRSSFERVIACLLQMHEKKESLFGNIHQYCPWGQVSFYDIHKYNHLPFIKVWTGR